MKHRWKGKTVIRAVLLTAVLLISFSLTAEADNTKVRPGEEITISVRVSANPDNAVSALLKLEYDHNTLELVSSDLIQKDTGTLLNLNGIAPGEAGRIVFRVNTEAAQGRYLVAVTVLEAETLEEVKVSTLQMETPVLIVGKARKKDEDSFYTDGRIKQKVEKNEEGNVQKITVYNRYGAVTRIDETEAWDENGNIIRANSSCPKEDGTYTRRICTYTYDAWGNRTGDQFMNEDGTPGQSASYEYDELDNRTKTVSYNEKGETDSILTDYGYDPAGRVISYTRLKPDGQVKEYVKNTWQDEILVERTDTDVQGMVTDRITYDPVYGDTLTSYDTSDDGIQYFSRYTYYEDSYEEDRSNFTAGYRSVLNYQPGGILTKETRYSRVDSEAEWTEQSTLFYSVNESGNKVSAEYCADGRKYETVYDANGRMTTAVSYRADGTFAYGRSCEYDSEGNEIRSNSLTESGRIESYTLYQYNEQRIRSKILHYKNDGTFIYGYSYEYDSEGRTIRSNRLGADDGIESYVLTEYNADGRMVRESSFDGSGTLKSYTEYEYDETGECSHYIQYRENSSKSYEVFYRIVDGDRQKRSISYNPDGTVRKEYDWE